MEEKIRQQKKELFQDKEKNFIEDNDLANKSKISFAYNVMEYYKQHDRRPTRANMQYLLWKYNKLETNQLLEQWGLINGYNQEYEEINNI